MLRKEAPKVAQAPKEPAVPTGVPAAADILPSADLMVPPTRRQVAARSTTPTLTSDAGSIQVSTGMRVAGSLIVVGTGFTLAACGGGTAPDQGSGNSTDCPPSASASVEAGATTEQSIGDQLRGIRSRIIGDGTPSPSASCDIPAQPLLGGAETEIEVDAARAAEFANSLEAAGVEVELSEDWKAAYPEAAQKLLGGKIKLEQLVPKLREENVNGQTQLAWYGEWYGEGFALEEGVTYNPQTGLHMKDGKAIFDHKEIFKFQESDGSYPIPDWFDVKTESDLDARVFVRRGGITRIGLDNEVSAFIGHGTAAQFAGAEQVEITLTGECEDGPTDAYQAAVSTFVWDGRAQDGTVSVQWADASGKFSEVDGRLISRLAHQMDNDELYEAIASIPAGWPVTPEGAAAITDTHPTYWRLELVDGVFEWIGEVGFAIQPGVVFEPGVGYTKNGKVLTDQHAIWNFSEYDQTKFLTEVTVGTNNGYLFARGGGEAMDPDWIGTSYFATGRDTVVKADRPSIEQLALRPNPLECLPSEALEFARQRAWIAASNEPDPTVRTYTQEGTVVTPVKQKRAN